MKSLLSSAWIGSRKTTMPMGTEATPDHADATVENICEFFRILRPGRSAKELVMTPSRAD